MKQHITLDEVAICFCSAVAYGFGFLIPSYFGCPFIVSLIICFIPGLLVEALAERVIFSKFIQSHQYRRVLAWIICIIIFLISSHLAIISLGEDLSEDLEEEFLWLFCIPAISLIISFITFQIKKHRVLKKYGDGSMGYIATQENRAFIRSLNGTNRIITGNYNVKHAAKTKTGIYVGKSRRGVTSYLGIPYAKPPVGDRRWQKPAPLEPSHQVHEAFYFGPSALQAKVRGNILNFHQQSEDCLYLNIWQASKKTSGKKPVIVYLHDGDYTYGGSANPAEEGRNFVKSHKDVIFVSLNYRLGLFGFVDFTDVPGGKAYPDAINCGLLDQIAALEWVKDNIAAFGGDPSNITVMGTGSGSTSAILLSNITKNLFQKVVAMSCNPDLLLYDNQSAKKLGTMLAAEFHAKSMAELSQVPAAKLKNVITKYYQEGNTPSCGSKLIPQDLYTLLQNNTQNHDIEYIIGLPRNEISNIKAVVGSKAVKEAVDNWKKDFIAEGGEFVRRKISDLIHQRSLSPKEKDKIIFKMANFVNFIYAPLLLASILNDTGHSVHCFLWDVTPSVQELQANALSFISTVLNNFEAGVELGYINDKTLREVTQTFLYKFITGQKLELYRNEIVGMKAFTWPRFTKQTKNVVRLNQDKISLDQNFYAKEIDTLDQLFK